MFQLLAVLLPLLLALELSLLAVEFVLLRVEHAQVAVDDLACAPYVALTILIHLMSRWSSNSRLTGLFSRKYSHARPSRATNSFGPLHPPPSGSYSASRLAVNSRDFFSFIISNTIAVVVPPSSPPMNPPMKAPSMGTGIRA